MKHDITLYSFTTWDRSAKVRWLLKELNVEHREHWIDRKRNENESPEYLKMNPMGRVPVIKVDGTTFFESGAICLYLADLFADRGLTPKPNTPERAQYLQWMAFASPTLDTIQQKIMIIEDITEQPLREKKETALLSDLRDAMMTLDTTLKASPFLTGSMFTAADISMGYHLYFLKMWPELDAVIADFPAVNQYLARLQERPAAQSSKAFSYED